MTKIKAVSTFYQKQQEDFLHPRWSMDLYEEESIPHGSESFSEVLKSKM